MDLDLSLGLRLSRERPLIRRERRRPRRIGAAGERMTSRQNVLSVPQDLALVELEIFDKAAGFCGSELLPGHEVDRYGPEAFRRLGRRRRQRRLLSVIIPGGLEDRLGDRNGSMTAGAAAAERLLAFGVVIADPHRTGHVAGE